jgi:hypothetical protein
MAFQRLAQGTPTAFQQLALGNWDRPPSTLKGLQPTPSRDFICLPHPPVIEGARAAIKAILLWQRMNLPVRIKSWLSKSELPTHFQHGDTCLSTMPSNASSSC